MSDPPLHIDSLVTPVGSVIGLTHCPGRCGLDSAGHHWLRDLDRDLAAIEVWQADVVITLIETAEFATYGVPTMPTAMGRQRFSWHHVPIADYSAPDERTLTAWQRAAPDVVDALSRNGRVLFHCAAGLGRTGCVVAKLLVDMGLQPDDAIASVRAHRPGSIETAAQVTFVSNSPRLLPSYTGAN
jgi:ADP-ribosyl-[dinitrogen reductase] hydrolase